MLLLIDNYDSFTHNLARYFVELGQDVQVVRNDAITCAEVRDLNPQYIVLSPGPCTPNESGVTLDVIKEFSSTHPILGVCLGYQAIAQVFGATVTHAKRIRHGKTSAVRHATSKLFMDIPETFTATRYHSLVVEEASLPDELVATAWCEEDGVTELMAFEHRNLPLMGVQFHPESHLTECGHQLLKNFLEISADGNC